MKVTTEITIEKNISKVWEVMGNQFAEVHKWSSNFQDSKPGGSPLFEGLNYSTRETITERGKTVQALEAFDPASFSLSYRITEGAPEIAKEAYATWRLEQLEDEKTNAIFDFHLPFFLSYK